LLPNIIGIRWRIVISGLTLKKEKEKEKEKEDNSILRVDLWVSFCDNGVWKAAIRAGKR
jgi:hypothetical protein